MQNTSAEGHSIAGREKQSKRFKMTGVSEHSHLQSGWKQTWGKSTEASESELCLGLSSCQTLYNSGVGRDSCLQLLLSLWPVNWFF